MESGPGFPATVVRSLYQGGRTVVDATPASDPDIMLNLSLQSSDVRESGATIHLSLIDGWVIPNH